MNVLDSSCWLEFAENSLIGISVEPIIADKKRLLVPTIVLYEVFKKLSSMEGSGYANRFIRGMLTAEVVPLGIPLSISAADISLQYQLSMADSVIYATTMQYNSILWTADKDFDGLPNVQYFDKTQQ